MTLRILARFGCANPTMRDAVHPESFRYRILIGSGSWMDRTQSLANVAKFTALAEAPVLGVAGIRQRVTAWGKQS